MHPAPRRRTEPGRDDRQADARPLQARRDAAGRPRQALATEYLQREHPQITVTHERQQVAAGIMDTELIAAAPEREPSPHASSGNIDTITTPPQDASKRSSPAPVNPSSTLNALSC
ncbi:hypothetical protein [Burkholderia stabilis]|uniref:hypothetical protein n=1 Tax=Burkholderia stabilis TaxID=95485 RepID=UPI001F4B1D11|nr:hypothetical protein [Burkholderia stabilis]